MSSHSASARPYLVYPEAWVGVRVGRCRGTDVVDHCSKLTFVVAVEELKLVSVRVAGEHGDDRVLVARHDLMVVERPRAIAASMTPRRDAGRGCTSASKHTRDCCTNWLHTETSSGRGAASARARRRPRPPAAPPQASAEHCLGSRRRRKQTEQSVSRADHHGSECGFRPYNVPGSAYSFLQQPISFFMRIQKLLDEHPSSFTEMARRPCKVKVSKPNLESR